MPPGRAGANEPPPCPPDQPRPTISISDPAGGGSIYATHALQARLERASSGGALARSWTAPGARVFTGDDEKRPTLVADTPGPLTLTAVVEITDYDRLPSRDDYSCTTVVITSVELQSAQPAAFGDFQRPRRFRGLGPNAYVADPTFSFTIKVAGPPPTCRH